MTALVVWIAGAFLLWLPGATLARLFRRESDAFVQLAMEIAIGITFWPLLFLWTSQIGWRWGAASARVMVLALAIAAIGNLRLPRTSPRFALTYAALFGAAIVSRVLQARELVFPAWVDSVHHAVIIRLLIDNGRVPATLDPFIPHGEVFYHWGYHSLVAFVSWVTGFTDAARLPPVMLAFGQLLNALTFVMVYAAGRVIFRNRYAGLAAATFATVVTVFPAYYVSWGRYTQLTGLLLLPPFLIALWRARDTFLIALLAAGLFLVHVRIAFFAAIAAVVMLIARRTFERRWAVAAGVAIILCAPWLAHLFAYRRSYGDFDNVAPLEDLFVKSNRELMALIIVLTFAAIWKKGAPWRPLLFIAAVTAAVAVIVQIPIGRIASNSSAIIALFLPMALAAGALVAWVMPRRILAVALVAVAIYGVMTFRHIVNPITVLADADDAAAMQWIREHTPRDARFLINGMQWIGGAYMGVDGGYWIPIVTGRSTIVPPALYAWSLPAGEVARINQAIELWRGFVVPDFGATYIYTNRARDNGRWRMIEQVPSARLVFVCGDVNIFTIARARSR